MADITIGDQQPRRVYTVGSTPQSVFTAPFPFLADTDVKVSVNAGLADQPLTLGADYTVTGAGGQSGTVTLVAPVSNCTVTVYRELPLERSTRFPAAGTLKIPALNAEFDRLVMMNQQQQDHIDRSLKLAASDDLGANATLPVAQQRAGRLFAFDGEGRPVMSDATVAQIEGTALAAWAQGNSIGDVPLYIGDGVRTRFPTGHILTSKAGVHVEVGGVFQAPDAYSLDGEDVVLSEPAPDGAEVHIRVLGVPVQLADASESMVIPAGATTARSLATRFGKVLELDDFGGDPTGEADSSAALLAAFAALPATGGAIRVIGNFRLDSAVTLGGKPFALIGDGTGFSNVSQTHTGTAITVVQTSLLHETIISGIEFTAANPLQPCVRAVDIEYPSLASFAFRTVLINGCTFTSAPAQYPGSAYSYVNGVRLKNCWNATLINNLMTGRPYTTLSEVTDGAMFEYLDWCMDTRIENCRTHFTKYFLKLSKYWEGLVITGCTAVGVGYGVWNDPSDTENPLYNGWRGFSAWITSTHIASLYGAVRLDGVKEIYITQPDFAKTVPADNLPSSEWYGVQGIGLSGLRMIGGYVEGGGSGATRVGVHLSNGTASSGDNFISGVRFGNCATYAVYLGTSVTRTYVDGCESIVSNNHANNFVDSSGFSTNAMRWRNGNKVACQTDYVFAGADGSSLFQIGNVPAAANFLRVTAGATGAPARLDVIGTDANAGTEFRNKGVSGLFLTNQDGAKFLGKFMPRSSPNAWLEIWQGDAANSPALIVDGAAASIGAKYQAKGGGGHAFFSWTGNSTDFQILPPPSTGATNYLQVAPKNAGVAPEIQAVGADTNINFGITTKGTGRLALSYAASAATTPANFTADEILEIYVGGVLRRIPCRSAAW